MATPKLKLGNDKWATKQRSLLAYNDEGNNFKSLPFQVERLSGGSYVGRNGLVQYAATEEPRIDFTNYSKGALLLEPQRTNNLLRSEEFDTSSWTKFSAGTGSNPAVTANYATAPDGRQTADRVIFDKGSGTTSSDLSQMRQIVTSVGQGVSSVYIKSNTSDSYIMGIDPVGNVTTIIVTPEWQRFTYSETTNDRLAIGLRGSQTSSFADVSVWGAQLEAGDYSTSYIPTADSTATRIADLTENDSIPGDLINSTEGTLFIDFEYLYETTSSSSTDANRDIFVLGTSADISEGISIDNYRSQFRVFVQGSGITTQSIGNNTTGAAQPNTRYKLAVKYKTGDCKSYLNGSLLGSGTGTVNFVTDLNGIFFSYNSSSRPYKNQKRVYDLQYFDEALTDAELQTLTTL